MAMQVTRAFFSILLAAALMLAPVAAGAMDQAMHAAPQTSVAEGSQLDHPDSMDCHDAAGSNEEAPGEGHCGACCLTHAGASLPEAPPVVVVPMFWGADIEAELASPFAVPARTYGLKRPPRA